MEANTLSAYITFGKEYELSAYLGFNGDRKTNDGSGPSEISIGPFTDFREAFIVEKLLHDIYGESLYRYFENEENEEKGNHFHIRLNGVSNEEFWKFYVLYTTFGFVYRKFFTLNNRFRYGVKRWCDKIAYYITHEELNNYRGREYRAFTVNRNRKTILTIEARLSEGSIALDIVNLLLSLPFYLELRNLDIKTLQKQLYILSKIDSLEDEEDISYYTFMYHDFYEIVKENSLLQKTIRDIENFTVEELDNDNKVYLVNFKELHETINDFIEYYKNNKDKLIDLLNESNYNTSLEILELVRLYAKENRDRFWLKNSIINNVFNKSKKEELEEALNIINNVVFENTISRLGFKLKLEK